jgi:hypothetical protein
MAQRVSGYDRVADDRYETPPEITATIVPYLRKLAKYVWEPAHSPKDKLGNVLREAGFNVTSTNGDFLKLGALPDERIQALVTNPPYGKQGKLAEAFIRHALDLEVPHVAMLLPVDFDSALTRTPLFDRESYFAGKIVLLRRIKWFPGSAGPSTNHAWFLWRNCAPVMPTISYATPAKPQRSTGENECIARGKREVA